MIQTNLIKSVENNSVIPMGNEPIEMETIDIAPVSPQLDIPEDWSYKKSVRKVKSFVYKWKNLTEQILAELWIAHEILSKVGNPHKNGTTVSIKTWNDYCEDIGVTKRTANRWLARFKNPKPTKPKEYDENKTPKYCCPECGYSWS